MTAKCKKSSAPLETTKWNIGGKQERTIIYYAAGQGDQKAVRFLLNNQADIEAIDKNGLTALIVAAQNGWTSTLKLHFEERATTNPEIRIKRTSALHFAADRARLKLYLYSWSMVQTHALTKDGLSPLGISHFHGNTELQD